MAASRWGLLNWMKNRHPVASSGIADEPAIDRRNDTITDTNDLQGNAPSLGLEPTSRSNFGSPDVIGRSDLNSTAIRSIKATSETHGRREDGPKQDGTAAGESSRFRARPNSEETRREVLINDAIRIILTHQLHDAFPDLDFNVHVKLLEEYKEDVEVVASEALLHAVSIYDASLDWCTQATPNTPVVMMNLVDYCRTVPRGKVVSRNDLSELAGLITPTRESWQLDEMPFEPMFAPCAKSESQASDRVGHKGRSQRAMGYRSILASRLQALFPELGLCFLQRLFDRHGSGIEDLIMSEWGPALHEWEPPRRMENTSRTDVARGDATIACPSPTQRPITPQPHTAFTSSTPSSAIQASVSSQTVGQESESTAHEMLRESLELPRPYPIAAIRPSKPELWSVCEETVQRLEQDEYLEYESSEYRREAITRKQEDAGLHSCNLFRLNTAARMQQMFPTIAMGFAMKLIEWYMDDFEQATGCLRERKLPPELAQSDFAEQLPMPVVELIPTPELFGELALPSVNDMKLTMLSRGWCPRQVDYFVERHSRRELIKFASKDRRKHRSEDHEACLLEDRCIKYNTPPDSAYYTSHTPTCRETASGCYMVRVPEQELLNVIRTGGVPLISIAESAAHHLSFRVHRRSFFTRYSTISHVWADGLGNPFENALPACQVRQLQSSANWLHEQPPLVKWNPLRERDPWWTLERYFASHRRRAMLWMDTLCIPVGKKHEAMRSQCIDSMASIYAGSSAVIVLDRELVETKLPFHPELAIAASVWMCRSWTLQEAMLPAQCVFKFQDGFYRPPPGPTSPGLRPTNGAFLIERFLRAEYAQGSKTDESLSPRRDMSFAKRSQTADLNSFIVTWNSLVGRGTTMADDLYLVLASCLDYKLRQFRGFYTTEERMYHMILSQEVLPCDLFFNPGPRLDVTGDHYNRWVPTKVSRHLLKNGSTFSTPGTGISTHSDQGTQIALHLGSDVSVFLVTGIIGPLLRYSIVSEDSYYGIQAVLAENDKFSFEGCVATCLIMDSIASRGLPSKGACFAVTKLRYPEDDQSGATYLELTYFCPLLITPMEPADVVSVGNHPAFPANPVSPHCSISVKYTPLRDWKRLRRHDPALETARSLYVLVLFMILSLAHSLAWLLLCGVVYFSLDTPNEEDLPPVLKKLWTSFGWPFLKHALKWPFVRAVILSDSTFLQALAILGPLFLYMVLWHLCTAILLYAADRLKDYIFLYQSYDDNTVMQRAGRLARVVIRAPYDGVQIFAERVRNRVRQEYAMAELGHSMQSVHGRNV